METLKDLEQILKASLVNNSYPLSDLSLLVEDILQIPYSKIYIFPEKKLKKSENLKLKKYLELIKKRTPTAYILGYKYFYEEKFIVNKDTLIPRNETEILIDYLKNKFLNPKNILDLGTGSACIAISLKKIFQNTKIIASDISKQALKVAKKNAKTLKTKIDFYQSDLFKNLKQKDFEIIVANLPYLKENFIHWSNLSEPNIALFSGQDGLNHYRRLADLLNNNKIKTNFLYLEISPEQNKTVPKLFKNKTNFKIIKDYQNRDRFIEIIF
jgi:release factor glutamine methyltransferase